MFERLMRKKLLPGNAKNSKVVELPALMALKGLNKIWFTEAHYNDILSIVLVWEIICQATHADTIYQVKKILWDARARKQDFTFYDEEVLFLNQVIPQMVDIVRKTPNNVVDAAIQKILGSTVD